MTGDGVRLLLLLRRSFPDLQLTRTRRGDYRAATWRFGFRRDVLPVNGYGSTAGGALIDLWNRSHHVR